MHFEASLGQLACYMFREFVTNLVFDGLTLGCAGTNWAISWPCLSPNQAVSGQIWPFLALIIPNIGSCWDAQLIERDDSMKSTKMKCKFLWGF